jgi:ferredoxin
MKLEWNQDRCVGQGLCYAKSPELWDCDDDGYAVLKVTGDIPAELEALAWATAKTCPESAITVVE